jgi:hypothetical protein
MDKINRRKVYRIERIVTKILSNPNDQMTNLDISPNLPSMKDPSPTKEATNGTKAIYKTGIVIKSRTH